MTDLLAKRSGRAVQLRRARGAWYARSLVPGGLRALHDAVVERAELTAEALLLTGSTVRRARTELSDLDYHLIGEQIDTDDLSPQLDVHVVAPELLETRVRDGDDFVHWSLRFGCVIFDTNVVKAAREMIDKERLWPRADRKRSQARKSLGMASAIIATGDRDAAREQARTALTLTARWWLLAHGIFPLSRPELPRQLQDADARTLAGSLALTIFAAPSLVELQHCVDTGVRLLDQRDPVLASASK